MTSFLLFEISVTVQNQFLYTESALISLINTSIQNQYFFQQDGISRINMGNSSSLPANMSKINTHLEK